MTVWARPGWAGPGLQRANEMSDKMWPDNEVQSDGEITQPPLPATQSFLGGNNKAPIPSDVYFLLCIFNFTYCIYVHNLSINVRCIEIIN